MICIYTVCHILVSYYVFSYACFFFSSHVFIMSICCPQPFSFILFLSSLFHHPFPFLEVYMPLMFFRQENVAFVNPFYLFLICLMARACIFLFSSLARSIPLCAICTVAGKEWGLYTSEKEGHRLKSSTCGYTKAINCVCRSAHFWIGCFLHYDLHTDLPRLCE